MSENDSSADRALVGPDVILLLTLGLDISSATSRGHLSADDGAWPQPLYRMSTEVVYRGYEEPLVAMVGRLLSDRVGIND